MKQPKYQLGDILVRVDSLKELHLIVGKVVQIDNQIRGDEKVNFEQITYTIEAQNEYSRVFENEAARLVKEEN